MLQVKIKKKLGNFLLDVDFSMDGGIFAILGASGCGKSMTLKCIAGIERPDEGRIVLNDRVLFDSAKRINLPPQKRKVGYMFQDYALFPTMNVVEYGSPKKPALMEAAALNMADNTDAKMETFTELFDNAKDPNEWLGYNRLFESNIRKTSM